jgi:hypothetical protein
VPCHCRISMCAQCSRVRRAVDALGAATSAAGGAAGQEHGAAAPADTPAACAGASSGRSPSTSAYGLVLEK